MGFALFTPLQNPDFCKIFLVIMVLIFAKMVFYLGLSVIFLGVYIFASVRGAKYASWNLSMAGFFFFIGIVDFTSYMITRVYYSMCLGTIKPSNLMGDTMGFNASSSSTAVADKTADN